MEEGSVRVILGTWGKMFVRDDSEAVYIDFGWRRIYRGEKSVSLSAHEFNYAAAILAAQGRLVETRRLVDCLYGDREDGGPSTFPKCMDVFKNRIRHYLAPLGISIRTDFGRGVEAHLVEPGVYPFQRGRHAGFDTAIHGVI